MSVIDTNGLDLQNTHRAVVIDGHTIHITLHSTRWRWDIYTPDGHHLFGYENSPGRAAHFAAYTLDQLLEVAS